MNTPATEAFVPLVATSMPSSDTAEFRVTVLGNAEHARPLNALSKASVTSPAPAQSAACEPRITLQRDGQRVSGIRVECTCGAVMDLACVYDSAK